MLKIKDFRFLALFILLSLGAGFVGSYFTFNSIPSWYAFLKKPFFAPPNFVFGPVWTFLYVTMGISAYLIWEKKKKSLVNFFLAHLLVNALWSIVFFGMQNILVALFIIFILWGMIFYMIVKFYKYSKLASYLLIPYICWVSFATALNFSLYFLNR